MIITDEKTIAQIQEEFHNKFPGLKIKFYATEHKKYEGSSDRDLLDRDLKIGDIRNIHETKDLKINPTDTVAYLEKIMHDVYGLNVQIYRRSKELWLQTSTTDDWTLEKQNSKGLHSMQSDVSLYD